MATMPTCYRCAAEPALLSGDPQKAAWLCEQALALAPHDQVRSGHPEHRLAHAGR